MGRLGPRLEHVVLCHGNDDDAAQLLEQLR